MTMKKWKIAQGTEMMTVGVLNCIFIKIKLAINEYPS